MRMIDLFDRATGKALPPLTGHQGRLWCLAFSPSGRRLVAGGEDGTALVWDLSDRMIVGRPQAVSICGRSLLTLWFDLAGEDAARAHQAMIRLVGAPKRALSFLQGNLRPIAAAPPERLGRLLADLDSPRFAVRQQATQELEKLEELAEPVLRQTLAGRPPLEVRRRVERLLAKLQGKVPTADRLRGLRSIEVLEHIGTPDARRLLQTLATGAPEARLTQEAEAALERLDRRAAAAW